MDFINCHTHIFSKNHIPKDFLPFGLVRLLAKKKTTKVIAKFLNLIHPFTHDDLLDRYANFIKTCNQTQRQILNNLIKIHYDGVLKNKKNNIFKNLKFCLLAIDFEFMQDDYKNKMEYYFKSDYAEQIAELEELKKIYKDNVLLFFCIDARRKDITEIAKNAIESGTFTGFKIYPALGFYPQDKRLLDIYEYAEENQIPIVYHISKGGIYYRGEASGWFNNHFSIRQKDCYQYTNPENFKELLKIFPKLKINLAHFGGETDWREYIKGTKDEENWVLKILDLIQNNENVYTDISYIGYIYEFLPYAKILLNTCCKNKLLYGSDFYMVEIDKPEQDYLSNVFNIFNSDELQTIAYFNPKRFLNI